MPIARTRKRAEAEDDAPIKKKTKEDSPLESISLADLGVHMIYQEINEDSAKDACEFLIKANFTWPSRKVLTLMLNSPGGSVYDGWGIIDTMEMSRLKIQTVGCGGIFSMAAVIFTAGTPGMRIMTRNSYLMTHTFSDEMEAKYHEFVAQRPHQDQIHKRMVKHFVDRTKMTEQQVNEMLLSPTDRYISAEECLELGICDAIKSPWE